MKKTKERRIQDAAQKYVEAFETLRVLGVSVNDWDIRDGTLSVEVIDDESGDKRWEFYELDPISKRLFEEVKKVLEST